MKALVISKPIYDYVLPLVEFPQDGDNFFINNSIETVNNIGSLVAITLAKYGIDVSYTGMIGEDEVGRKVKELLESYNIDTKYIETSYTEKTTKNHKIYNSKSNRFTSILENSIKTNLTKYKYEFIPDVVVMDDGDYGANLAAINNYPNSKLIYIGDKYTKDSVVYCNKCNYVITSLSFVCNATGVNVNLNKPKTVVQMFQKFIDLYNSNLIIKLDNFDVLYCINDEVRLIKNINKNIINKDNLYNAILTYFLINTNDIENSIKLTNKVMLETTNELDMIKNIPEYKLVKEIFDNIPKMNVQEDVFRTAENNQNSNKLNINNDTNSILNNNTNLINNNSTINNTFNDENNNVNVEIVETPKLENKHGNGVNEIEKL